MSQKGNFGSYTCVFEDKEHNGMIKSTIIHNPADENQIWMPFHSAYYYLHQIVMQLVNLC